MRDRKLKRFKKLILIVCALSCNACAPKVRDLSPETGTIQAGPRLQDRDLKLDGKTPPAARIAFNSDVTAAAIYRMSENILSLKDTLDHSGQATWTRSLIATMPHTRTAIVDSPYMSMMIARAKSETSTELRGLLPKLNEEPKQIRHLIATLPAPLDHHEDLDGSMSLATLLNRTFSFLRRFDAAISSLQLIPQVETAIHEGLATYLREEQRANQVVRAIGETKTIRKTVELVKTAIGEFGFSIPSTDLAMLGKVEKIGLETDRISDAKSAFNLLVDIWVFLSPKQRIQTFQAANAELYDYFKGLSTDDLACLQSPTCSSLPKWLARTLVIYPKLEQYGIGKIRDLVNAGGADAVRSEIATVIASEVRKLPSIVGDRVEAGIHEGLAPINKLQSNFEGELKSRIQTWAKASIEKEAPSVYNASPVRAHLRVSASGERATQVAVSWTLLHSSENEIEDAGALSSLAPLLWQGGGLNEADARALLLSNVGTLAAAYQASGSAQGSEPGEDDAGNPLSVSARAYAETIRGFSTMAESFRDWKSNAFDTLLGGFTAQDLFPEINISALNQPMFPKGAFYALSFQSLSDHLKTATGDHTQVFLVDAQNRITQPSDATVDPSSDGDRTPVMAGIADRIGDQLSTHVRAEDVARYLISMCGVLEASRSVETSTSPYLLQQDSGGQIPRDEIIKSRDEIRLLILGLANYLSHQFRSGGELIYKELVISTAQPTDAKVTVMDQALSIRALVAASDALGIDLYRWEAVDLVSALNRNMYRDDLGFYARPEDGTVSPLVLLETVRAMDAVGPYLRPESRHQIDVLTAPWRARIAGWNFVGSERAATN